MKAMLTSIKKLLFKSPGLIFLVVFVISCIAAFFLCPYGIALSVSVYDGVFTGSNFVPILPYMLVGGFFMWVFSRWAHVDRKGLVASAILMLLHLYFLRGSIA